MPKPAHREKWADIVRELDLDLSQPVSFVTAREIKRVTGLEPRNMAYVDSKETLPRILAEHGVFPLPVTNGKYALVRGNGFHDLEDCGPPDPYSAELSFPLVTLAAGKGEAQQLDLAYNSGLLSHFSGVNDLRLTIRGRMHTPPFGFRVDGSPDIPTRSVQIEVDGGYEAPREVLIFEAKIGRPCSFITRQLYYPYRTWRELAASKSVRLFFMTSIPEQRIMTIWEYEFTDPLDYESIRLVDRRAKSYRIHEHPLDAEAFIDVAPSKSKGRAVPQADDISKVLEFPFLVSEGMDNSRAIAKYFAFNRRQSSYYREATETLGLVELAGSTYRLTDLGRRYVSLPPNRRNQFLLRLALEIPVMHEVFMQAIEAGRKGVGVDEIAGIIKRVSGLSGSTLLRRAQTVKSWFRWVDASMGLIRVSPNRIFIREGDESRSRQSALAG